MIGIMTMIIGHDKLFFLEGLCQMIRNHKGNALQGEFIAELSLLVYAYMISDQMW